MKFMHSYARFVVLTVCTMLALLTSFAAAAEDDYERAAKAGVRQRMALVIGNSSYPAEPLPNASRDALTMEERLRSLGFSVERHLNLNEADFRVTLRQFWARANRSGGDAVFFYAGHGLGLGGRNYLVPIDVDLKSAAAIRATSIDLTDAIGARAKAHPDLNRIVILDACRTDPTRRGVLDGQAAGFLVTDAPSSLISFSTSLGKRGLDGPSGTNSYFTKHLAKELLVDEIEASVLFTRVRSLVVRDTNEYQTPVEFNTLRSPFVFRSAHAESLSEEEQQIKQEITLRQSRGLSAVPEDKVGQATEQLYRAITLQLDSEQQQRRATEARVAAEQRAREARLALDAKRKFEAAETERQRIALVAMDNALALAQARATELERLRVARLEAERIEAERLARVAEAERVAKADRLRAEAALIASANALAAEQRRVAEQERAAKLQREMDAEIERARLAVAKREDERVRAAAAQAIETARVAEIERQRLATLEAERLAESIRTSQLAAQNARAAEAQRVADLKRAATLKQEQDAETERIAAVRRETERVRAAAVAQERETARIAEIERRRLASQEAERLAKNIEAARIAAQKAQSSSAEERLAEQHAAQIFAESERARGDAERAAQQAEAHLRSALDAVSASERVLRDALVEGRPAIQNRPPRRDADGSLLVRGVKLPANLKITTPGADVPAHCSVFSGGWNGVRWEDIRTAEIWVESVAPDCTLSVVYATGGMSVTGSAPNFQRTQSRVVNGEAQIRLRSGSTIVLTAPGNRTLNATLKDVNRGMFEADFDGFDKEFTTDTGGYAFEQRRSGVMESVAIRITNFWKPLPDSAPGATTITTLELEALLRENPNTVLVDAIYIVPRELVRGSRWTDPLDSGVRKSIPGALRMADFGFAQLPSAQKFFAAEAIARTTSGDKNRPIVVFERNTRYGWYGYHVVLRLAGLGYTNIRWYRGGLDAWHDAGFALN